MKKIENKVVVITGAASGIGRALAIEFASLGAKLSLNDYDAIGLEDTRQLIKEKCPSVDVFTKIFDVSNLVEFSEFANETASKFDSIDVVINNAGISTSKGKIEDITFNDIYKVLDINIKGVVSGSKLFIPHLKKEKEASLVNISSVFGIIAPPEQSPYVASKFAVKGFNESLYLELKNTSICVSSVHPGGIKTNIGKNSKRVYHTKEEEYLLEEFEKKALITSPETAAKIIIEGIKKKKRKILIGKDAKLINLLNAISPRLMRFILLKIEKINKI